MLVPDAHVTCINLKGYNGKLLSYGNSYSVKSVSANKKYLRFHGMKGTFKASRFVLSSSPAFGFATMVKEHNVAVTENRPYAYFLTSSLTLQYSAPYDGEMVIACPSNGSAMYVRHRSDPIFLIADPFKGVDPSLISSVKFKGIKYELLSKRHDAYKEVIPDEPNECHGLTYFKYQNPSDAMRGYYNNSTFHASDLAYLNFGNTVSNGSIKVPVLEMGTPNVGVLSTLWFLYDLDIKFKRQPKVYAPFNADQIVTILKTDPRQKILRKGSEVKIVCPVSDLFVKVEYKGEIYTTRKKYLKRVQVSS